MKRVLSLGILAMVGFVLAGAASAQTPGVFRGVVHGSSSDPNWIFVQAVNGMSRRVEVSKAEVVWGDTIPASARTASPKAALKEGAEVRVTATSNGSGDWEARRVEILRLQGMPVQDVPRLSDRLPANVAE